MPRAIPPPATTAAARLCESLPTERLCRLYGAEYANVQPHSGAQANMAVFFAVLHPGDTFMGLDLAHGGHLSHGSPVNMSGKYFKAVGYRLDEATGRIDYDAMERLAEARRLIRASGTTSACARSPTRSGRCCSSTWPTRRV